MIGTGSWLVESDHPWEAVNTLPHEDRHAYQNYVIEHPEMHDDVAEVAAWRENSDNYVSFPEDPVL